MRILWLCNCALSDEDLGRTGTWLDAMAEGLLASDQVELGVVALGATTEFAQRDYRQAKQWIVPAAERPGRSGLPGSARVDEIVGACNGFAPDLVHVWGTEYFWGLLTCRGLLKAPSILTMQGVKYRIAEWCRGNITLCDRLACLGVPEFYAVLTGRQHKKALEQWERFEREIMAGHRWAICQTPWQEAQVKSNRPDAVLFHLDLPLRAAFEQSEGWEGATETPRIFCVSSYGQPAKGLHVAVRALALVKRRFPDVQMRIAGAKPGCGIRRDGYLHWLSREVSRCGLERNICWLGRLSAAQLACELRTASVTVIPTFIESYSMAFAEAMWMGTPTVVSYTGGTAYLGRDEETCLFFPLGDEAMCAYQLERVLTDRELALRLSRQARQIAVVRNDGQAIVRRQLKIYRQVLGVES